MVFRQWMKTMMIVFWFEIFFMLIDATRDTSFNENYYVTWGNDHIMFSKQGREVQLSLDRYSGFIFLGGIFFSCSLILYIDGFLIFY